MPKNQINLPILGLAAGAIYLATRPSTPAKVGAVDNILFLPNVHVIKLTYVGATNYKGSQVKIQSERFKQTKLISYNRRFDNIAEVAADYLQKMGFEIVAKGESKDGMYLITNTFEPIK
jgi:hypothetical protein